MELTAAGLKTAFSMALVAPTPLETVAPNEDDFFGTTEEDEEFEWKLLTAQNRINEILDEHQEIHSRQIQNIDCSTGVL